MGDGRECVITVVVRRVVPILGLAVVLHEQGPMAPVLDRWVTLCDGRIVAAEPHGATDCAPDVPESSSLGWLDPVAGVRR